MIRTCESCKSLRITVNPYANPHDENRLGIEGTEAIWKCILNILLKIVFWKWLHDVILQSDITVSMTSQTVLYFVQAFNWCLLYLCILHRLFSEIDQLSSMHR